MNFYNHYPTWGDLARIAEDHTLNQLIAESLLYGLSGLAAFLMLCLVRSQVTDVELEKHKMTFTTLDWVIKILMLLALFRVGHLTVRLYETHYIVF